MDTDLYLIMKLLQEVIPDDISNKILLNLLGLSKTMTARCIKQCKIVSKSCGMQYEVIPQQTRMQEMAMYEIRISQFDRDVNKKKQPSAIKNIKRYMKLLDERFNQRFRLLYC